MLTVVEADRLRTLYAQALESEGISVTVHPDYLAAGGAQFGMTNLAARCKQEPPQAWAALIAEHARIMKAADPRSEPAPMDQLDMLRQVRARLLASDFAPADVMETSFNYRRPIADGLTAVLALDYPDHVAMMTDDLVAQFDPVQLWQTGLRWLADEPFGEVQAVTIGDAHFQAVLGGSVFTASRLLTMPDVLERATGSAEAPLGVLVGVPCRDQLAFHVLRDNSVADALNGLMLFTRAGYSDGLGPVSPELYYWSAGEVSRVTYPSESGGIDVRVEGAFASAMEGLR